MKITTRFQGPTARKGARIIARGDGRTLTVPYNHAIDAVANHEVAAKGIASVAGFSGALEPVKTKSTKGYAWNATQQQQ